MQRQLAKLLDDASAATAVEYAFMLALILLACIASIALMGVAHADMWQRTVDTMDVYMP
jgi:Flp pilus assembly pilin Flp